MRLQRIYSSKLYLTSSRKDKIHAAMNSTDTWNVELVQQLEEYLGDEAKEQLEVAKSQVTNPETNDTTPEVAPSGLSPSGGGGGGAPSSSFTGDVFSDFGTDEFEGGGEAAGDEVSVEPAAEPEAPVEESTKVDGTSITATSTIWTTPEDAVSQCNVIQGTLNAREDTKGVNRLQVKDSELWIYFNDDVNLNDTMINVIEVLNSTGYTYLTFNRLARSNNAIVFDINLNLIPIKTVEEIEETK